MTDLDKAREWAERWSEDDPLILADAKAAIKLIKALPDQWVDVEKVREVISGQLSFYTSGTASHYIAEKITRNLESLLTPKPPTLADMTPEERAACKWMQARVYDNDGTVVLLSLNEARQSAKYLCPGKEMGSRGYSAVTPLPDLPKLKWPGGTDDCEIVEEPETTNSGSIHTPMQPSEVPPNEPWLVEANGRKAVGTRYEGDVIVPWSVAALDGGFAGDYNDNEITLIHKLVAEPPALPEGMRIADHARYGRVVVSPKVDTEGDHGAFYSNENSSTETGAGWTYVNKSELTFLDGDQRA